MNCARHLATILDSWSVEKGKTVYQVRGSNGQGEFFPPLWANVRGAVALMLEVEDAVRDMEAAGEDMSHFQEAIPHWWIAVTAPRLDWAVVQSASKPAIEKPYLWLLLGLASTLDRGEKNVAPDEAAIEQLTNVLLQVEASAKSDDRLAHSMRTRIAGLISHVRFILSDYQRYSPEQLQHILDELSGVLVRTAAQSREPASKRLWHKLGLQVAVGLVTNGAWESGQAAVDAIFAGGPSGIAE